MRLRITRQLSESIDGIQMSAFRRGYVYDVGTTIGSYLLAVGAAEPVTDDHPYIVLPPEKQLFYPGPAVAAPAKHRHPSRPRLAVAADRPPRRRPSRKAGDSPLTGLRHRVAALVAEIKRIKRQLDGLSRARQPGRKEITA